MVSENTTGKSQTRLLLISEELLNMTEKVDILPGYRSDQSMIILEIKFSNFRQGKGFWKLNNSLLQDLEYVNKVNAIIKKTLKHMLLLRIIEKTWLNWT